ncbi:MAG: thiol-disulfide oxidoreductase DCC family protein [Candidatus Binataceae bacterium]
MAASDVIGTAAGVIPGRACAGRIAVLYDGACELCRVSAEAVLMFDNSGVIDLKDIHTESARAQFPGLTMERLMTELHVVDEHGRVWRGARAVNEVLRRQNGARGYLAYLWYLPGFAWLADHQYKRIAASRYALDPCRGAAQPAAASKTERPTIVRP